jgi:acyl dehydratase
VTAAENHQFCLLTMAVSPIHTDANFAAKERADGRNIVVGSFIYALLLGMSVPDISGRAIANLGVERLRHVAPLYHDDTLYGSSTVLSTRVSRSNPTQGILTVRTAGHNQNDELVCEFERAVLLPLRDRG